MKKLSTPLLRQTNQICLFVKFKYQNNETKKINQTSEEDKILHDYGPQEGPSRRVYTNYTIITPYLYKMKNKNDD